MLIYVFPPHYQLVYINFDISSFSLISYMSFNRYLLHKRTLFVAVFFPDAWIFDSFLLPEKSFVAGRVWLSIVCQNHDFWLFLHSVALLFGEWALLRSVLSWIFWVFIILFLSVDLLFKRLGKLVGRHHIVSHHIAQVVLIKI